MRVFNASLTLATDEKEPEISDITTLVADIIHSSSVTTGIALISTPHTTCALFVNQSEAALIDDLKGLVERLIPAGGDRRHVEPRHSPFDRENTRAHLRSALLGQSIMVGVNSGKLALSGFQSVIFAEFDGPRQREVHVQVIGD